jgi:hypothetical protein
LVGSPGFLCGRMWQKAKRFFCFRPPRANQVSSAPSHGHLTGVPCPRIHAYTHLPVRHTGHSPAVASPEGTPFSPSPSHLGSIWSPPCSLYPATDWTATSRSYCRHPCLSSQSLLIAFSAQALGRIWLARKAVRRRFMRKKIGIPEKKRFPLVCPPCPPLFPPTLSVAACAPAATSPSELRACQPPLGFV